MTLVSLQLWLENRKIDAAKIEIIEDNNNLFMIPSTKGDRVATFQKIVRGKSWVIGMEGNIDDGPSNRSIFILKVLIAGHFICLCKICSLPPCLSIGQRN